MIDPMPILDEIETMLKNALERNDKQRLDVIDDLFTIQRLRNDVKRLKEETEAVEAAKIKMGTKEE